MGLPDFHTIQSGYTEIVADDDLYVHNGASNQTVYTYTGFGEIISLEIFFDKDTANFNLTDYVRLYIDDELVSQRYLFEMLRNRTGLVTTIINPVYFLQYSQLTIMIMAGLKFNNKLDINLNKGDAGKINCWAVAAYGLY